MTNYERLKKYFNETPREEVLKAWEKADEDAKVVKSPTVKEFLENNVGLPGIDGTVIEIELDNNYKVNPVLEAEKLGFAFQIGDLEKKYNFTVLLAFVRGSHMYGTSNKNSDVDITFVYQQPTDEVLKLNYVEQVSVGGNDVVGYEIQRFLELLGQNNPNILEALDIPEDCLIYMHDSMADVLKQELWLSKLTEKTILGYANSQIKKATGLNKKMNNPVVEKKDLVDFCYIIQSEKSIPVREFIKNIQLQNNREWDVEGTSGLVKIPNGKGLYGLYLDPSGTANFRGILKDSESTQLRLSSIPKDWSYKPYTMWYNEDGFQTYCKDYASYQQWLVERNDERHNTNSKHGKNYDSKNMMHLFRLLEMAFIVATTGKIKVRTDNLNTLVQIREGKADYDVLMKVAENFFDKIKQEFESSKLPEHIDIEIMKQLILKFRKNEPK